MFKKNVGINIIQYGRGSVTIELNYGNNKNADAGCFRTSPINIHCIKVYYNN